MRSYLVLKCSCGTENVFPVWSKEGKPHLIKVTEDPIQMQCNCGASMELLSRPITPKELDDLKACMSLCGTKKEVDDLTL